MPRLNAPLGLPLGLRGAAPLLLPAIFAGLLLAGGAAVTRADEPPEAPPAREGSVALEDRLAADLKVRRPEDVAFLERIGRMVREGRLPEKVVTSTSSWALRRGKARPFPSFRRALEMQADRLGVELDDER